MEQLTPYAIAFLTILMGALGFLFTVVWKQLNDRINRLEANQKEIEGHQKEHNNRLYEKLDHIDEKITDWQLEMVGSYVKRSECDKHHRKAG